MFSFSLAKSIACLFFSERTIMRCHSVYHNESKIKTKYAQKDGGLNKMTISRFLKIISNHSDIVIRKKIRCSAHQRAFNGCLDITNVRLSRIVHAFPRGELIVPKCVQKWEWGPGYPPQPGTASHMPPVA